MDKCILALPKCELELKIIMVELLFYGIVVYEEKDLEVWDSYESMVCENRRL